MLILSRSLDDVVVIEVGGERIEVKVIELKYGLVKLGFTASPEVRINRKEIRDRPDYRGEYREANLRVVPIDAIRDAK